MYINLTNEQLNILQDALALAQDDRQYESNYIPVEEDKADLLSAAKRFEYLRDELYRQSEAERESGTDKIHVACQVPGRRDPQRLRRRAPAHPPQERPDHSDPGRGREEGAERPHPRRKREGQVNTPRPFSSQGLWYAYILCVYIPHTYNLHTLSICTHGHNAHDVLHQQGEGREPLADIFSRPYP